MTAAAVNTHHPSITYRPEIDALRAIAVLPVLFFHAGSDLFSGGYVGVDVFFVISGFLITSIVMKDLNKGQFSILRFYDRRIRRIFPALLVVIMATLVAAYFIMLPRDFGNTGRSAVRAAAFLSNHWFWLSTNYFAAPAETQALLHTWSLAVEEQFYVVFPIFLWLVYRFARPFLIWSLVAVGIASFILCYFAMQRDASFAFYMFPTRAWELAIGSFLAVAPQKRPFGEAFTAIGLAMIGYAVFAYTENTPFPGTAALLPCIGTALVIHFSPNTRIAKAMEFRPFVFTGLISYSLYLWHWPILVFWRYIVIRPLTPTEAFIAISLSFLLAILSWRFIERPIRCMREVSAWKMVGGGLAAAAIPAALGLAIVYANGLPQRLPNDIVKVADARLYYPTQHGRCEQLTQFTAAWMCKVGAEGKEPSFALWGDSHAGSWLPGIDEAAKRSGQAGLLFTANGCPPVLGAKTANATNDCPNFEKVVKERLDETKIGTLILAARWPIYERPGKLLAGDLNKWRDMISKSIDTLAEKHRVFIVYAVPGGEYNVPSAEARRLRFGSDVQLSPSLAEIRSRDTLMRKIGAKLEKEGLATTLDPTEALCGSKSCPAVIKGRPQYTDETHMVAEASRRGGVIFDKVFAGADPATK